MPLLKFHLFRGRTDQQIERLLHIAHEAMVASFGVPDRDRYQVVQEHEPSRFKIEDTGLGIPRSEDFVLLEVVSRPRPRDQKERFYHRLASDLHEFCSIAPADLMISFVENSDEDWSFGYGKAQFLTGEL